MTTRRAAEAPEETPEEATADQPLLTRAAILAADDIRYDYVEVPEWGGRVRVRSLTGTERDKYDAESYRAGQAEGGSSLDEFRVRRVGRAIVDANGLRVFSDKDFAVLGAKNGAVIDRIDDAVVALSAMGEGSVDKAKADLKVVPSDSSGSD